MDYDKRWKSNRTDSVIAMLMGLDKQPLQQPIHEKHRGLSRNYVNKAASVGLRPGSSVPVQRSSSRDSNILDAVECVSEYKDTLLVEKCLSYSTSKVKPGTRSPRSADVSISKPSPRSGSEGVRSFGRRGEFCTPGSVLRYLQKLELDCLTGHFGEFGASKSKSEKVTYGESRELLRPGSGKYGKKLPEKVANDAVSSEHGCIGCTRNMKKKAQQERQESKFEEVLRQRYMVEKYLPNEPEGHDYKKCDSAPHGPKKHTSKRWQSAKKVAEVGISGKGLSLDEMLALAEKKSMSRNLNKGPGKNGSCTPSPVQSRSSGSSRPSVVSSLDVSEEEKGTRSSGWNSKKDEYADIQSDLNSQKEILEPEVATDVEQFHTSPDVSDAWSPSSKFSELSSCYLSCFGSGHNTPESLLIHDYQVQMSICPKKDPCREIEDSERFSESSISIIACQGVPNDIVARADASNIEAFLNEFSEEGSAYSNCSEPGPPESRGSLKRTNQHSPNSVLEPFDIQNSSSFEHFESISLQLQLQVLNLEREETYSEGSVVDISGNEGSEDDLGDPCHEDRFVKTWLGDDQSRNFSYLVDVLDEAGIFGMKSYMDFKDWHSVECPISPSVFEALEKKYGKQTSWEKSERQLLFDRINSVLIGIFNPMIDFHPCMKRRFCAGLRRDEIEDELWTILISHENERNRGLSEKAVGEWLPLEEGINIICRELEASIFDELVMELASL